MTPTTRSLALLGLLLAGTITAAVRGGSGTTWPMFGGAPARNMVNLVDKNLPLTWNVEEGKRKNIQWVADLGSNAYGGPVVADGKVFVGTNNANPRDDKEKGARAVLMAFNVADGKFLWQIAHDIPDDITTKDALTQGLCSTPIVEDQRLYYVTPGCQVICASTGGKIEWTYDMAKELKVFPCHLANCSPLIVGELLMVVTSNGVNEEFTLPSPQAPSFIAIHKKTGKLAWQSALPGANIIEGQWSNPTLAVVKGQPQVIFPGGDCFLYSLEPQTGELLWKCNCYPLPKKPKVINYIIATPVVVGDRLYIGLGPYPGHYNSPRSSHFLCLDITKKGDVSLKSYDAKSPANKDSALVWAFGGMIEPRPERGRDAIFGSTISTAAVHDGLVYISEERGYLHCLDAQTGTRYWEHDFKSTVWGSPYYVDGKIYHTSEDGDVVVFEHGKTRKILATNSMDESVLHSTPVAANGVLYVTTRSKLYAIAQGK